MAQKYVKFSEKSKAEKLRQARREYQAAVSADTRFIKKAIVANKFYSGDQYTKEEEAVLKADGRPALTCNMIKPTVELIKGVLEQNKKTPKAEPTEKNDGFLADILNDVHEKVRQIGSIENEEDDCFENKVITGRGFCAVDIAPDPKRPGEIRIPVVSIPPNEIKLDPAGRKNDLSDHSYIFWHKWISIEDFMIQYPDAAKDLEDILAGESGGDLFGEDADADDRDDFDLPVDTPVDDEYSTVMETGYYDKANNQVLVVHKEYWDTYDRYYGVNPATGQLEEFDKEKLPILKKMIPGFQYQTIQDKKVKWFQFTGHKVLYDGDSPIPYDGFSIVAEFGYKDKSKPVISHFGVVQDMIDPQRETNKRWSQTLNLFLKQSQGGYFVEQSAILDDKDWRDTINAPGESTMVADGALSQGKIQPKGEPQLPVASVQLHELGKEIMKQVSGVNPDLLGIQGKASEPGVVVRIRQNQGLTLLRGMFKGHEAMQKELAKRIYAIIMQYMPDSQIKRILGSSKNYVFKGDLVADIKNGIIAPIRNLRDLKYNISVEETTASMTKNMAQLAIFMEMMNKGFPVDPITVIGRLDIPEKDKRAWKEYVQNAQKANQQMQQAQLQLKASVDQGKRQTAEERIKLDAQKAQAKHALNVQALEQKELKDRRDFFAEMSKLNVEDKKMIMDLISKLAGSPMQLPQIAGGQ